MATLGRSVFVLSGLLCGYFWLNYGNEVLRLLSFILIISGYTADLLDGWLARREAVKPASAKWGGWYDAETDAVLLLLSCLFLTFFDGIPMIVLFPGILRYAFALLYSFFPSKLKFVKWFHWYSKTVAAVFESVIALLWCTLLMKGESLILSKFLLFQINIFIPMNIVLILSSFIIETIFRLMTVLNAIPGGYRRGLLKSFIIYFRIPFRHRKMKKFYGEFLRPSDLAFDVGAHIGGRTRIFSELGAQVVCFEPQPACRGLIELWFESDESVHLNYSALGAIEDKVTMMLSKKNPTLASTDSGWVSSIQRQHDFRDIRWDDTYETEVKTLDSMIDKYGKPRLIKIDTEGNEADVLAGLNFAADVISFEFIPSEKKRAMDCLQRLTEIGSYGFNFSVGESMRMDLSDAVSADQMRKMIESYPAEARSGDIYAILQNTD